MYITELKLENFKCFGQAKVEFRYPGDGKPGLDNINVVLGDNGSGKSALLKAIILGILAEALSSSGFVPYWLVRRPNAEKGQISARTMIESASMRSLFENFENGVIDSEAHPFFQPLFGVDFWPRDNSPLEHLDPYELSDPVLSAMFDEQSHLMFIAAYGTSRRAETGDYSSSAARQMRGLTYQRVASLFEDQFSLRPMEAWYSKYSDRQVEITQTINSLLPEEVDFVHFDEKGGMTFKVLENAVPYLVLSDGYKAFIAWISDLLGRMCDVCPEDMALSDMPGIVLVDEIDLHLHPQWQRNVVPSLAKALPNMQFILTTHSPIVLSSVRRENVFVCERQADGTATISNPKEKTFGRGVEQLLMSGYFGLTTTRTDGFMQAANVLFDDAASGDADAALAYLEQLAKPPSDIEELSEKFADAKLRAERSER